MKQYSEGGNWKDGDRGKRRRLERYLEWLLTPKESRQPRLKKEFAAEIGVTVATLANYDRDPWLQRELVKEMKGLFKAQKLEDIISTLYDVATDATNKNVVSAARLLLDWQDRVVDSREEFSLESLPTAEIIRALEDAAKQVKS